MSHLGRRSFSRFVIVGASTTLLTYATMFLLLCTERFSPASASGTAFFLITFFSYWANARFTFAGHHNHAQSLPRFIVTTSVGLGMNQLVLISLMHIGLHVALAQILATGTVLVWNYVINAIWSFRVRHSS